MAGNTPNRPGIYFSEIDQTIRPNAVPGDGIGAIVINANRGVPNQRVLSTSINKFYEQFGQPDEPNQYGHFAADVYFTYGGATQLLAVRATQGDEGYAQIQYPYTDSIDVNNVSGIQRIDFVDNNMGDNLRLIDVIPTEVYSQDLAETEGFVADIVGAPFSYRGKSDVMKVSDIYENFAGNLTENIYVYRDRGENGVKPGTSYWLATLDDDNNVLVDPNMFAIDDDHKADQVRPYVDSMDRQNDLWYEQDTNVSASIGGNTYSETVLHVPQSVSLNGKVANITTYATETTDTLTIPSLLEKTYSYTTKDVEPEVNRQYIEEEVRRVELVDWDDGLTKTFYVPKKDYEDKQYVYAIQYTEYGNADSKYILIRSKSEDISKAVEKIKCSEVTKDSQWYPKMKALADEYGVDVSEISNEKYGIIEFQLAKEFPSENEEELEPQRVLVVSKPEIYSADYKNLYNAFEYTWVLFLEHQSQNVTIMSNYGINPPKNIIKPWQVDKDGVDKVAPMTAISSTEVFSDPTGIWKDGYTPSCETDAEPGNGDIEMYQSTLTNQLVIGAIGPGEFGNDVGISIITPEAAGIPALDGKANAFSWKYRFDDQDKVDQASDNYRDNPENLTWKKVYKINVYVKAKNKTEESWGFGLDALNQEPVESWIVSNDPTVKDENGNSLWAPYVINGKSRYIYVSKKSVENSVDYMGRYSMPMMTYSIYQMTGGTNSRLNNIKEKTKALDLYRDRKKATFDYLFNVEPIETFNGRQRYMAMQQRIAQIAMNRGMDLGIIQATSKEAKTIRQKLSEAKMFSFSNGSYVAAYDDYDRYFDQYTSTWVMLPKSVAAATAMCFCDMYSYSWMAPAGVSNGTIGYSNRPMTKLDDDELEDLFNININYSSSYVGYGEVLMAQKTMLKKESALNRVDVRKLCNYIEKRLDNKLFPYLYQKNTVTNRSSMRTTVDTFMGRIQTAGGIESRTVEVVPDPTDTHLVYVRISFIPTESIERIQVVLILNRASGSITAQESTQRI